MRCGCRARPVPIATVLWPHFANLEREIECMLLLCRLQDAPSSPNYSKPRVTKVGHCELPTRPVNHSQTRCAATCAYSSSKAQVRQWQSTAITHSIHTNIQLHVLTCQVQPPCFAVPSGVPAPVCLRGPATACPAAHEHSSS